MITLHRSLNNNTLFSFNRNNFITVVFCCFFFVKIYVSVNSNWVHLPRQSPGISSKTCPGGPDLTFESCPGSGNSTRAGILSGT